MERTPIQTNSVAMVKLPPIVESLYPDYRYQFQSKEVPEEADHMYSKLQDFIKTNSELVQNNQDSFSSGFKNALAIVRLWIDSIYVEKE